ncbi:MAG: hypothetical protein ACI4I9_09680 [Porcipelethomonas sp.]
MKINILFFLIEFLIFAGTAITVFSLTGKSRSRITVRICNAAVKISSVLTGLSLVLLILELTGAADLSGYRLLSVYNAGFAVISLLLSLFRDRFIQKTGSIGKFCFRLLTVCFFLELFVFNINSAHLLGNDYTTGSLNLESGNPSIFNSENGTINVTGGYYTLDYSGLDMPVGTITIDALSSTKGSVKFDISITDDTNSADYRSNIANAEIIRENRRSRTVPCNFSGNVHNLKLGFSADENEYITIKSIVLNMPVRFNFSLLRFMIIYICGFIAYALSSKKLLYRNYSERRKAFRISAWILTSALICVSLFITNMSRYQDAQHSLKKDFQSSTGNQISKEIVDAFEAGTTELQFEANDEILALENPYDWSQRNNVNYLWDHLLYNGKYYSYYGIGPVLALFLPYHMITGYYFPSSWAIFLFGALGIIFLTKLYLCLADKFFRKTPASLLLTGLALIQFSTGIFFCYCTANFYEIAQASGFLCVTAGAFFLLSSNIIGNGEIKNFRLAVSAFCLSMGVLCRPTLAVYCLAALLFIFAGFRKKKNLYQGGSKIKYYMPYFCCALLPFIVIGSIQMWYNYARFGNPLDFGIQYSLTINDFTKAEYHTHFAAIGFFNYLFALPRFTEVFPFFTAGDAMTFNPQGYYFLATGAALGILWKALPVCGYGKFRTAYRLSESKDKKLYALLIFAVCIACPFAVIFSIWESGYGTRYCVDFAWQIIIGALIICFIVYEKSKENTKKHLNKLMIFSGFLSLVMNFVQIYSYLKPAEIFIQKWQANVLSFGRLFEFWR